MKKVQQGFTLIELMIVIAIVGILAATALPAYNDYTKRAKMSEVLVVASKDKTSVSEYFLSAGAYPTAGQSGINFNAAAQSKYLTAITYSTTPSVANIVYTVDIDQNPGTTDDNGTFVFQGLAGSDGISWECGGSKTDTAGTLAVKYLPANCR